MLKCIRLICMNRIWNNISNPSLLELAGMTHKILFSQIPIQFRSTSNPRSNLLAPHAPRFISPMNRSRRSITRTRKSQRQKPYPRHRPYPTRVLYSVINEFFQISNRSRRIARTGGEDFTLGLSRRIQETPFNFNSVGLPLPRILRQSVVCFHSETEEMRWVHYSDNESNCLLKDLLWIAQFTREYWSPELKIGYPIVSIYPIVIFKHSDKITRKRATQRLCRLMNQSVNTCVSQTMSQTVWSYMF